MKRSFSAISAQSSSLSSPAKRMAPTTTRPGRITLTPLEKQLKDLLVDVADSINNGSLVVNTGGVNEANGSDARAAAAAAAAAHISASSTAPSEPVVLRWAGGWVRDKLLGIESNDIDTAINSMTGEGFATAMRVFCDVEANSKRHGIGPDDVGSLHKVERNPEKSKHLETATTKLLGLVLDFVNLRKETYADDSRNPEVEFGTPEEDALRRDATVNALFYNLHTEQVEDFAGGLEDLEKGLIRTPMEPLQTFLDDPLRVLRLVRFATRLQFKIDGETEEVMGNEKVLDKLKLKITRERVGVELEKMLKGALAPAARFPDWIRS
jgi:tRNA nucleotidyltransferase (CCA-adding enzyme)